jgi:hypothetical protein
MWRKADISPLFFVIRQIFSLKINLFPSFVPCFKIIRFSLNPQGEKRFTIFVLNIKRGQNK